jgi:hypothetical protein
MENAVIDYMGHDGIQGDVAAYIAGNGRMDPWSMKPFYDVKTHQVCVMVHKGGNPKDPANYAARPINIQVNAGTLRRDEWQRLDEAVLRVSEQRLGGIQDLISNGLTYDIGSGMNTTVLEYHDVSDALAAEMTMDGLNRAVNDRPVYTAVYLPLPIIHCDYQINARVLAASRNMGNPLDTTLAERAARKVNEYLEDLLFTAPTTAYAFGGGTIYGYLNHPDRNQVTLSQNWDASGKTGAEILQDVLDMKQTSINAYHYGPWMLYIPTAYETVLDDDYDTTTPGTTIRERIMKVAGIKGIQVVDRLTANNVILAEMNTDTVRLVRGMGIQNVEWQIEGKMITKYKVMTIQVPQVRSDQEGNSGIVHLS